MSVYCFDCDAHHETIFCPRKEAERMKNKNSEAVKVSAISEKLMDAIKGIKDEK